MNGELVYLDAGVLVNLCATKRAEEILLAGPYRCAVVEKMREEPLSFWAEALEAGSEQPQSERLPFDTLVHHNALELHEFVFEQCGETFINFAVAFCDVQAMMLAMAVTNLAPVATDDRRIRRELRQLTPTVQVLSTLSLLQSWQQKLHLSDQEMQLLARLVTRRALFNPAEDDPLASWWRELVK
jgi:hypothetical protein